MAEKKRIKDVEVAKLLARVVRRKEKREGRG